MLCVAGHTLQYQVVAHTVFCQFVSFIPPTPTHPFLFRPQLRPRWQRGLLRFLVGDCYVFRIRGNKPLMVKNRLLATVVVVLLAEEGGGWDLLS